MQTGYVLGAHFENFVKQLVESGRYTSASEVVRDSLRLMEAHEAARTTKLGRLRVSIQEGLDSGEPMPLDMNEVLGKARERKSRSIDRPGPA